MRPSLLVLLLLAGCSHGRIIKWDQTSCRRYERPRPWGVCLTTSLSAGNADIVYHLHGAGGGEKDWSSESGYGAQVRRRWEATGFKPPAVAAVSFGPEWLLAERNASPDSGLFEEFEGQIIPEIDLLLDQPPRRRMLVGESMGGFNAAELALKRPALFDRAALLCPGLPALPPRAAPEEVDAYVVSTGAKPGRVAASLKLLGRYFPDAKSWQKASPLLLIKSALPAKLPRLYVSCGRADEYGFYPGARSFAAAAKTAGADVTWRPLDGGHCVVDPKSLADFLAAE